MIYFVLFTIVALSIIAAIICEPHISILKYTNLFTFKTERKFVLLYRVGSRNIDTRAKCLFII